MHFPVYSAVERPPVDITILRRGFVHKNTIPVLLLSNPQMHQTCGK